MIVSAQRSKLAPARADAGSNFLLSGPTKKRIRWGTIRPTKPMIPETETHTAVTSEAVTRRMTLTLLVSTPREAADRSPSDMTFRSRAKKTKTKNPRDTKKRVKKTSTQVFDPKLPINQKIMMETCSSATYLMKLIPADKMAATMIPERIRLLEEI